MQYQKMLAGQSRWLTSLTHFTRVADFFLDKPQQTFAGEKQKWLLVHRQAFFSFSSCERIFRHWTNESLGYRGKQMKPKEELGGTESQVVPVGQRGESSHRNWVYSLEGIVMHNNRLKFTFPLTGAKLEARALETRYLILNSGFVCLYKCPSTLALYS